MADALTAGWLLLLAALSLVAVTLALLVRNRLWHTQRVPAQTGRLVVGAAFAGWVDPSLGILAAVSAVWWARYEWTRVDGGILWPQIAMAVWLGRQAPEWALAASVALLLAIGVLQVLVALCQRFHVQWFFLPAVDPHGTIGHRTGLGIFLALLVPLTFATDYAVWLLPIYAVGLWIARSAVADLAAFAGLVIVAPGYALWTLPGVVVLLARRAFKRKPGGLKLRHVRDSFEARWSIWRLTLAAILRWPAWLVGHGAQSFEAFSRRWIARMGFKEHYRQCHSDYLEFAYEYGAVGVLAVAIWLARFGDGLAIGDPVTGSLGAFAVAMGANFPARVAPLVAVALLMVVMLMRRSTGGAA